MDPRPIFIGGIERSGTSLLYALLTSHPNIIMTRRTNLWAFFNNRYGELSQPENLKRCISDLMRYQRITVLQPDPERLRQEFMGGEPSYIRLFTLIWKQVSEQAGKPRWGDKSLNTERYADQIFKAYPQAKILQLVRDPRDRFASALKRWKVIRGGAGSGTAMWLDSVKLGLRNCEKYPDRYLMVRYETLAAKPEETLKEICNFIEEDYTPQMLSMEGAEMFRDEGGNSSYEAREPGVISTSSIGKYRKVLNTRHVAFIQTMAAKYMRLFDYPLEPLHMPLAEQARYALVDFPLNLARMTAWRGRESLFEHTGRPIPSNRWVTDVNGAHA